MLTRPPTVRFPRPVRVQLVDQSFYTRFVFRAKNAKISTFYREHNFFSRSQNFLKIKLEPVNYILNNIYSLEF